MEEMIELALNKIGELEKKVEKYFEILEVKNELDFILKGSYVLKEELDLSLDPHRFLCVGRADNDQIFRLLKCVGNRISKIARDGKFILIPEYSLDLLPSGLFLYVCRNDKMLEIALNMLCNL